MYTCTWHRRLCGGETWRHEDTYEGMKVNIHKHSISKYYWIIEWVIDFQFSIFIVFQRQFRSVSGLLSVMISLDWSPTIFESKLLDSPQNILHFNELNFQIEHIFTRINIESVMSKAFRLSIIFSLLRHFNPRICKKREYFAYFTRTRSLYRNGNFLLFSHRQYWRLTLNCVHLLFSISWIVSSSENWVKIANLLSIYINSIEPSTDNLFICGIWNVQALNGAINSN